MPFTRWLAVVVVGLSLAGCLDSNSPATDLQSGLRQLQSGGAERSYYLDLPADYDPDADPRPLIIAYHGTGGSHEAWLDTYRLKADAVGDGAILVYPDARPNAAGVRQWDFEDDFQMFEDLLEQLPDIVTYDPDRILVTGHSSGGGFSHEIGCRYGDRIRAIAPVAGSLTATTCTGSVAVLQIQGNKDSVVPVGIAELGHNFWVLYNGFDLPLSSPGVQAPCIDHSLGASPYAMQWCLHEEGDGPTAHDWPGFASDAIWAFFQALPDAAPRAAPPEGGGNDRVLADADTTLSFTLRYPVDIGPPVSAAAVIVPFGTRQPVTGAPVAFLNLNFAPAAVGGDERSYQIPVQFLNLGGAVTFPGDYTIEFVVYVDGGGFPIPAAGVDHVALVDVSLTGETDPIVIPGVLDLEVVRTTP